MARRRGRPVRREPVNRQKKWNQEDEKRRVRGLSFSKAKAELAELEPQLAEFEADREANHRHWLPGQARRKNRRLEKTRFIVQQLRKRVARG